MPDSIAVRKSRLGDMARSSSVLLAVCVIAILLVMIVPLPTIVLDVLLSLSIIISIMILLMSMYVLKPLDFSAFPSVLLVVTLLRLSLNVASTRLILLHGNEGTGAAGQVIKAFGTFVVGGNYVVGMIVFSVLVLINFIVITKGATRIAEVAARFTLDAMPGKQMSIDADLNTGLISDSEARKRRRDIENEANFYGAMDGASKFVRGDAAAGIIIVLVNIIGGLIIGVLQQDMPIADAARTYLLLTVGDGLVTQVPALIVSTAAGMLVTRTTASAELGEEIKKQVFTQPKAMALSAVMLFTFALIPGMPKMAFFVVAAVMAFFAFKLFQSTEKEKEPEAAPLAPVLDTSAELLVPLDPLGLEVGYGLISLVDTSQGGELLHRVRALRKQLANDMGFIMPAVHIRDNLQLKSNEYSFLIKGIEVARGEIVQDHHLVIIPDDAGVKISGVQTREPAFGLPAVWIPDREVENVQARGLVVVDAATVVTTHITEIVKSNVEELLGRQEVQAILDSLAASYPKIVEELVPKIVPLGTLQKVLQRLLKERVAIRDMLLIVETLADYVPMTKNIDILTEYVRQALARTITRQYQDRDNTIHVIMVSPEIEDIIGRSVQHTERESFASPDPGLIRNFIASAHKLMDRFTSKGIPPVVLCSPNTRVHLRKIMERFFPNIVVLSHNEITPNANVTSLGMVEI
jgi:flagellar biosynthesis protein FlhA